jgi:hypothetical protein
MKKLSKDDKLRILRESLNDFANGCHGFVPFVIGKHLRRDGYLDDLVCDKWNVGLAHRFCLPQKQYEQGSWKTCWSY